MWQSLLYSIPDIIKWLCNPLQFNEHYDGDSISIYNIDTTDGSRKLIARLSGPDKGPQSKYEHSNWAEKFISTSSNIMEVEFESDAGIEFKGFSATIHFNEFQNKRCESWMDQNKQTLESPNYPNLYGNDIFCTYLITVQPNFHIRLSFEEFDVGL